MPKRSYEGDAIDLSGQHIADAPHWTDDGETVAASDDDQFEGEDLATDVPDPTESELSCKFPGCNTSTKPGTTYCVECRGAMQGGGGDA